MADADKKGCLEAHTPRGSGKISPETAQYVGSDDAAPASDAADFADALAMIDGSPDLLPLGGLATAAENIASQRRGRGRPKGSANKRNTSLFDYLEALGHRDPAVTLSMWQTADTKELAKALGVGGSSKALLAVAALQVRAAGELLPYKYAKKPQQLDLVDGANQRAVMVIGELNGSVNMLIDGGFMSAGVAPGQIVENQALSDVPACDKNQSCHTDEPSD